MGSIDPERIQQATRGDHRAIDELLIQLLPGLHAFSRLRAGAVLLELDGAGDLVPSTCRDARYAGLPHHEVAAEMGRSGVAVRSLAQPRAGAARRVSRLAAAGIAAYGQRAAPPMSKLVKRCAVLLAGMACSLSLAEAALWALDLPDDREVFAIMGPDAPCFMRDPVLLWRLRPDAALYRPNRAGLRGYWPAQDAPGDRLRVVCVGDSSTFAVGGRAEDGYGAQLERLLHERAPGHGFEVLLAALPGHSTYQNLRLYDHLVRPLAPDLVVVYAAGWNDSRPAFGLPDAAFTEAEQAFDRAPWSALRTARAVRQAIVRQRARAAREAAAAGAVPRRVPLDAFADHVATLLAHAREDGAATAVLVPPLPRATVAEHPELEDYRGALRAVAARAGAVVVDGERAFGDHDAGLPDAVRAAAGPASPCFLDYVHPSSLGHRVLATALADALAPWLAALPPSGAAAVALDGVALGAGGTSLRATGRGLAGLGGADRVFFGDHWLRAARASSDGELVATLPAHLPAGWYALELRTARGAVRGPAVAVEPRALAVRADAAARRVEAAIDGCPPSRVRVWFSAALAQQPRATPYGAFALLAADPPGAAALPVRWGELALPALESTTGGGTWRADLAVDVALDPAAPVYAQALLVDPDEPFEGCLTAPVRVRFTR